MEALEAAKKSAVRCRARAARCSRGREAEQGAGKHVANQIIQAFNTGNPLAQLPFVGGYLTVPQLSMSQDEKLGGLAVDISVAIGSLGFASSAGLGRGASLALAAAKPANLVQILGREAADLTRDILRGETATERSNS